MHGRCRSTSLDDDGSTRRSEDTDEFTASSDATDRRCHDRQMRPLQHRWPAAAVAVSTCSLILLAPAAAVAASSTFWDPRGDAPPSADVTRYTITNGDTVLRAAVKVVNLASQSDITLYVNPGGAGRYVLRTAPIGKGTLMFERGAESTKVTCDWTLRRYTGDKSIMIVRIPQTCF